MAGPSSSTARNSAVSSLKTKRDTSSSAGHSESYRLHRLSGPIARFERSRSVNPVIIVIARAYWRSIVAAAPRILAAVPQSVAPPDWFTSPAAPPRRSAFGGWRDYPDSDWQSRRGASHLCQKRPHIIVSFSYCRGGALLLSYPCHSHQHRLLAIRH
jgi:hypothetical protein